LCKLRATGEVARYRLPIGLHDKHPPVASVVGGDRRLFAHDLVKTWDITQILRYGQRFLAYLLPVSGKALGVGKQPVAVEDR
jgi:hypothetical protein